MVDNIINLFKKDVKSLKDYLVLITVSAKNYQKTNVEIIKFLINQDKTPGVYVTLNKPHNIIERLLKTNNIDPRVIIFIDGATPQSNKKNKKEKNCLFIGSPEKLSDISVAMDQAVKALPKEKFVFFDSINTLTIFNNPATVARFAHYLMGKMREWKIKGIIITLKKEADKNLLDQLTQLSDSRIDIGGN